jgi:hypothetical protein
MEINEWKPCRNIRWRILFKLTIRIATRGRQLTSNATPFYLARHGLPPRGFSVDVMA